MEPAPAGNLGGLGAFPWPRQAAPGWVSILVSKQDLREPAIPFSHFADEETGSHSLSMNNFLSAHSSAGSALLCCASE